MAQSNEQILTKASNNVYIFDTFNLLVDEQGLLNQEFALDELQLNEVGYAHLNEELIQFLDAQGFTP